MKNPRDNIKYDIPKKWIENFKKGCCPVCAKTKFEFDKGMRVYCSKKCREEYGERIYTWQELRDRTLKERGKKCEKCNKTQVDLTKEKGDYKNEQRKSVFKRHPEILEQERKRLMNQAEDYYQKALNLKEEDIYPYQYSCEIKELPYMWDTFELDHIKAVCNGGDFWDEDNLQILCYSCHKEKTKADMALKKANKEKDKGFKKI